MANPAAYSTLGKATCKGKNRILLSLSYSCIIFAYCIDYHFQAANRESGAENGEENVDSDEDSDESEGTSEDEDQALQCAQS